MDTTQVLSKTGSLIWRYRAVCLFGVLLVTGVLLVAAKDAYTTRLTRLEQLAQIKDEMPSADARISGPSRGNSWHASKTRCPPQGLASVALHDWSNWHAPKTRCSPRRLASPARL